MVLYLIIRLAVYCNMITNRMIFYSISILKGLNYILHLVGLTDVKDKGETG